MIKSKTSEEIKNFYSRLKFPGEYTIENIKACSDHIFNPYLKIIDSHLENDISVADIGCGSGYISNLFSYRYNLKMTGIDFSDAVDYAEDFSKKNKIKNIKYVKQDLFDIDQTKRYDVVICQGVLHHVPEFERAAEILKNITGKKLILSVYHPYGKILKRYFNINYGKEILRLDQEDVPFETSFNKNQVLELFKDFELVENYPSQPWLHFMMNPFRYSRNGGLTTYILSKKWN